MSAAPTATPIKCALCGHTYSDPARTGCEGCPLNDGCLLTCCPNCGYSAPEPAASRVLAVGGAVRRGARRIRGRRR